MMRRILLLASLVLAACAETHPVTSIGPDTYQIKHVMAKTAPNEGMKNALVKLGEARCAEDNNAPYYQVGEDITTAGRYQTITLTFQCKSVLKGTQFTSSYADTFVSSPTTYVPPLPQPKHDQ